MKNTIVLVDDHKGLLEVCSEILEAEGFKVIGFTDPAEAKKFLSLERNLTNIYAIVSDLMMGPTDGLDFLSFVKSRPELAPIDFFLMTGAEVSIFEPFYRPYVLKGIIEKPFKPQTLVNTIKGKVIHAPLKMAA